MKTWRPHLCSDLLHPALAYYSTRLPSMIPAVAASRRMSCLWKLYQSPKTEEVGFSHEYQSSKRSESIIHATTEYTWHRLFGSKNCAQSWTGLTETTENQCKQQPSRAADLAENKTAMRRQRHLKSDIISRSTWLYSPCGKFHNRVDLQHSL